MGALHAKVLDQMTGELLAYFKHEEEDGARDIGKVRELLQRLRGIWS